MNIGQMLWHLLVHGIYDMLSEHLNSTVTP